MSDQRVSALMKLSQLESGRYAKANQVTTSRAKRQERRETAQRRGNVLTQWGNMPAGETTKENIAALRLVQHRAFLSDERRPVGRANDTRSLPKFFSIGTVVDSSTTKRLRKRDRADNLADEWLKTAEARTMVAKVRKRTKIDSVVRNSLVPSDLFKDVEAAAAKRAPIAHDGGDEVSSYEVPRLPARREKKGRGASRSSHKR